MKERMGWVSALALIVVAALAYLPLLNQIGYSHDDWYLMASARAEGAQIFHTIYSVDRPLRAYVLAPAYRLFGQNVLFYNLSAWAFRLLSALLFLWLLRMLWPGRSRWTLLMALLFLLYPGFLSQYNGIDYQAQILSLALAMLSLGLTVQAFFEERRLYRILEIVLAIVLGILYLGLVEYEVGFEFLRWMLLFTLTGRLVYPYRERIVSTLKRWLPHALILIGFGTWRIFFFHSERKATDIDLQFGQARLYPIQTLYHWTVQVVQDLYDVIFSAWTIPLSQLTAYIQRWGGLLAVVVTALILLLWIKLKDRDPDQDPSRVSFPQEALLLGLLSAIGGLIPIAMVNREVAFPFFSRYSLASSAGVCILVVALLSVIDRAAVRNALMAVILFVSLLTQHANAIKFARETSVYKMFWWQVSWRVPQLQRNTTLVANYPLGGAEEDYFVWGPASLIYYPEKQNPAAVQPGVYATVLDENAVLKILTRERQQYDNRKNIVTYPNYRNILVLSQPTAVSCVHVFDGAHPEFSQNELDSIRVIAPYSETEHVLAEEAPHAPPAVVFGPEPDRGWCYYYEKADLARQQGNWQQVSKLGSEAFRQGLFPADGIEWMPFLQAYAATGDVEQLTKSAPAVVSDHYAALQACRLLGSMPDLAADVVATIDSLYCLE